jgi:hypothetical protein
MLYLWYGFSSYFLKCFFKYIFFYFLKFIFNINSSKQFKIKIKINLFQKKLLKHKKTLDGF